MRKAAASEWSRRTPISPAHPPIALQSLTRIKPGRKALNYYSAPSKLARSSLGTRADWPLTARSLSPAQPCARRDVRLSQGAPPYNCPSKLACFLRIRSSLVQSKRARVKEHRLAENTIGLVCAFREHKRLTGHPASSYTGRGARTNDHRGQDPRRPLDGSSWRSQALIARCGFTPRLSRDSLSASTTQL